VAYLFRLIVLSFFLIAPYVHAQVTSYPSVKMWRWLVNSSTYVAASSAVFTQDEACSNSYTPSNGSGAKRVTETHCQYYVSTTQVWGNLFPWSTASVQRCPYGGTLSNGQCVSLPACPEGQVRQEDGQCVPPPSPCSGPNEYDADTTGSSPFCQCVAGWTTGPDGQCSVSKCQDWYDSGVTLNVTTSLPFDSTVCHSGCSVTRSTVPGGSSSYSYTTSDGSTKFMTQVRHTGQHCSSSADVEADPTNPDVPPDETEPAPSDPQPSSCAAGTCPGTFNGQQICLPCSAQDVVNESSKVVTNPDGSTVTTEITQRDYKNANGTVTRETIVTTTTRDAQGNVVSTSVTGSTSNAPKSGFCEENPTADICGVGRYSASCNEQFICEGDAVQCGIALESHKTACSLNATESVLAEFESIRSFTGIGSGEGLDVRQVDSSNLDVPMIGGGPGLSDVSVTVMGQTVVLPFSKLNLYLQMFGYAMLAIAWIMAYRIISGAF
jgi:hypothetical protein